MRVLQHTFKPSGPMQCQHEMNLKLCLRVTCKGCFLAAKGNFSDFGLTSHVRPAARIKGF